MVVKYGSLLALSAVLLVGCGSERLLEKEDDGLGEGESTLSCHIETQPIYQLHQRSGVVGEEVVVRGVVHAQFLGSANLNGFYIQALKEDFQDNLEVSQGLFVSMPGLEHIRIGEEVVVQGRVERQEGQLQLSDVEHIGYCGKGSPIVFTELEYPLEDAEMIHRTAGMAVRLKGPEYVADVSRLGTHGELTLATELPWYPTDKQAPSAEAYQKSDPLAKVNQKQRVLLDDGSYVVYPAMVPFPEPELLASNTLRVGDKVLGLQGVFTNHEGQMRFHLSDKATFVFSNPRTKKPQLATEAEIEAGEKDEEQAYQRTDAELRLATVNTWRYQPGTHSFVRQRPKILALFEGLEADVFAVQQVMNDGVGPLSALADLVDLLNLETEGAPYEFVQYDASAVGDAEVLNAIIYRRDRVKEIGQAAVLNSGDFAGELNRPLVAQTFEHRESGAAFTFVAAQFAARTCTEGSMQSELLKDREDGQACASLARLEASQALLNWIVLAPTGHASAPVAIAGDFNAYRQEQPIRTIEAAGFYNTHEKIQAGFTWAEQGFVGNLDYVFVDSQLKSAVVTADTWQVNADEPPAFNYEVKNKSTRQQSTWYAKDAYRSAERNPVVVRLDTKKML